MASQRAISVRLDADAAAALRSLEAGGMSRSEAIRQSLVLAAGQQQTRAALAKEAAALATNADDLREKQRITAELDEISDSW